LVEPIVHPVDRAIIKALRGAAELIDYRYVTYDQKTAALFEAIAAWIKSRESGVNGLGTRP
jgi:hypothetical protein